MMTHFSRKQRAARQRAEEAARQTAWNAELRRPIMSDRKVALLFVHLIPSAQMAGLFAGGPDRVSSNLENHKRGLQEAEAKNGTKGERLAGCYHECGHIVVGMHFGHLPLRLSLDAGNNGRADRDVERLIRDDETKWTWEHELIITAAGEAAKARYREAMQQVRAGSADGAEGDISKFVLILRLLRDPEWKRMASHIKTFNEQTAGLFFDLLDEFPRVIGKGDDGFSEWTRKVEAVPSVETAMRAIQGLILFRPPTPQELGLWNQYVRKADEVLSHGENWRCVEELAARLDEQRDIPPDEVVRLVKSTLAASQQGVPPLRSEAENV